MGHAAEDDTPMLKRRSRTAMITPTSKTKRDEAEGGVAGATKAGTSAVRKKAGSTTNMKAVPMSSEVGNEDVRRGHILEHGDYQNNNSHEAVYYGGHEAEGGMYWCKDQDYESDRSRR
ncbi:hypothetical protein BKA82DRAFT_4358681 [Pisolithus tinctorius]|nr:hypothetical protein BKA82DRAFT_4358681 [Pisolithus tinctorius]